uniref:Fibronectin type-III domain-containing protein n=1 Tax=Paramormyrops kingsleyae TaxID=1676925 RepID=A0A3B3RM09_9TELE
MDDILTPFFPSDLRCLNDLINNITCVWNSTARKPDTACTLHGFYQRQHKSVSLLGHSEIKMHPPALHTFTNATIAWSPGFPLSEYIFSYYFQLQFKRSDQIWENAESVNVRDMRTSVEISEEKLEKGVVYDFRVRALVDRERFSGEWSDWSPVSSWRSTAGVSPTEPPGTAVQEYSFFCDFMLYSTVLRNYRVTLLFNSFQKWMHPVFPPEYFVPPQHSEDISPIEISALDKGMSYICSSHQCTNETEVCQIYFNYHTSEASEKGDSSGSLMIDSGFVQSSHSYEPLEQHCQPRQSMDEEEEDLPMEASLPSDLSVFPLSFPFGPSLIPNNLPGFSHFPSGLAGLDLHTSLDDQSSLLNISPSSGGYMIVTDTCDSC